MKPNQLKSLNQFANSPPWLFLVVLILELGLIEPISAAPMQPSRFVISETVKNDSIEKDALSTDSMDTDSVDLDILPDIRRIGQRRWVDASYREVDYLHSKDYESNQLGLYYSLQNHWDDAGWSALGYKTQSKGFALQLMSGNRLKGEKYSLYGGIEFGVQYFNHSAVDSIIVNLTDQKIAESFIRSRTTDLQMRWQFEYSQQRIKPYTSVALGARLMTTQQKVSQIDVEGIYDPSNVHGISNRSAAIGTFALGTKFMIMPWLCIDVRNEWTVGSNEVEVVNYNKTNLEGVLYAPEVQKRNLNSSQFKVGLIFNFDKRDTRTILEEAGHFEYACLSVYTDTTSKSVQILCKNNEQTEWHNTEDECYTEVEEQAEDSVGYEKMVTQSYWVEDYYDYRDIVPGQYFTNGFIAFHYSQVNLLNGSDWKSMGYRDRMRGTSIQFMSKNLTERRNVGLYLGGDINVQFWDRSIRDTLFINSTKIDAGYGYNVARSGDIVLRSIIEYNPYRFVPYATVAIGVRFFDMNKNVKGMLNSTEYESNYEARASNGTAGGSFGYGGRVKLSKFIHLDVRQEWTFALTKFRILPLGEYDDPSGEVKLSLHTKQWKVGLIFDMSFGHREYALIEPAHQVIDGSEVLCNYDLDSPSQSPSSYLSLSEIKTMEPCDSNLNPNINHKIYPTTNDPTPRSTMSNSTYVDPVEEKKSTTTIKTKTPNRKKPFPGVREKEEKKIDW